METRVGLSAPAWASAALSAQVVRCLATTCGGLGLDAHLADCSVVLDGGRTIPAHKLLLSRSAFLRKLLRNQERRGEDRPSIVFSGFSPVVVAKMIKFMYTGEVSFIWGSEMAFEFLELARQLHLNPAVRKDPKPGPKPRPIPGPNLRRKPGPKSRTKPQPTIGPKAQRALSPGNADPTDRSVPQQESAVDEVRAVMADVCDEIDFFETSLESLRANGDVMPTTGSAMHSAEEDLTGGGGFRMPDNFDLPEEVIANATNRSYGDTDEDMEAVASQQSSLAASEEAQHSTKEGESEENISQNQHDVSGESGDFFKEMEKEYNQPASARESHSPAASSNSTSAALSSLPGTSSASHFSSSQKRVSKLATKPAAIMPSVKDELEAKRLRMQEKLGGGFSVSSYRPKPKIERYNSRNLFHADTDEESDNEPEPERQKPSSSIVLSSTSSSSSEDEAPRRKARKATPSTSKRRKKERRRAAEGGSSETSSETSDSSSESHDEKEEVVPLSSSSSRRDGSSRITPTGSGKLAKVSVQLHPPAIVELAQYRLKLLADNSSDDESDTSIRSSNVATKKRKRIVAPVNDDDDDEEPIPAKSQKTHLVAEVKPSTDLFGSSQHTYGLSSERELPNLQALEELKKKSFKKKNLKALEELTRKKVFKKKAAVTFP